MASAWRGWSRRVSVVPRARVEQPFERRGPRQAALGVAAQQPQTNLVEIVGDLGCDASGWRRVASCLARAQLVPGAVERPSSGQRFVERDADGVPVARLRGSGAGMLLGRQIGWRARHAIVRDSRVRQGVAGQAEVKDDQASVAPDQDVGRLDVAMELALAVQRRHARDELPQDVSGPGRDRPVLPSRVGTRRPPPGLARTPTHSGRPPAPS